MGEGCRGGREWVARVRREGHFSESTLGTARTLQTTVLHHIFKKLKKQNNQFMGRTQNGTQIVTNEPVLQTSNINTPKGRRKKLASVTLGNNT